jgi:hypothetical protein
MNVMPQSFHYALSSLKQEGGLSRVKVGEIDGPVPEQTIQRGCTDGVGSKDKPEELPIVVWTCIEQPVVSFTSQHCSTASIAFLISSTSHVILSNVSSGSLSRTVSLFDTSDEVVFLA